MTPRATQSASRRVFTACAVVTMALATVGAPGPLAAPRAAAAGGGGDCSQSSPGFHKACVEVPVNEPGSAGDPGGGEPSRSGGGSSQPASPLDCRWVNYIDQSVMPQLYPDAPPGSVLQQYVCWHQGVQLYGPYVTRVAVPTQVFGSAPGPSPAVMAEALMIRVERLLVAPDVASDPDQGEAAIVGVPTFVAVRNWQGTVTRTECGLGTCVTLTATPTLTFDPGEPGSDVVRCDPPGTRFRAGGDARAQAEAPGACAHSYARRTGVEGRPDAWPGEVTVTWEIGWDSNQGVSGTFDPVALSTGVPRAVDEVSALVVDADPSA